MVTVSCLSATALISTFNVSSANAQDYPDRGSEYPQISYHGGNHRYCRQLERSIERLENYRDELRSRYQDDEDQDRRLEHITRELREQKFEYRTACQ